MKHPETILITGANGQIGSVLVRALRTVYGNNAVLATDIRRPLEDSGPFEILDVLYPSRFKELAARYSITQIYHLAAILSAKGEQHPQQAWDINMRGLFNVLELAREMNLRVFFPSSIAVFGPSTPRVRTPQDTVTQPTTVYGISKVAGENWCQYYHLRYGVDARSVRYPGIIGYQSLPGGGTTDYAVEIFHEAINGKSYSCFLKPDASLPMLYMDDAIRATLELMEASDEQIKIRTSYNLAGDSFSPAELAAAIRQHIPGFQIDYAPDFRQQIAESWPASIDDSKALTDWGWKPRFDLPAMVRDMLERLAAHYVVKIPALGTPHP